MKKEKEIFVYAVFKNPITLEYVATVFAGQTETTYGIGNIWTLLPKSEKVSFSFPSVRQAKKFIRQSFRDEDSLEYACIVVDGKIKGIWWTHTKKHIETITISRFTHELWTNGGVVANRIFKGLWSD